MRDISVIGLLFRRLAQEWVLIPIIFVTVVMTCFLAAGFPIYLDSLDRLAFHRELDQKVGEYLNINIFVSRVPLTRTAIQANEDALTDAVEIHIDGAVPFKERFLKTGTFFAGLPTSPLPEHDPMGRIVSRGHFQSLTNLEGNAHFVHGRMATGMVGEGDRGPTIEAVISQPTAQRFDLVVGSTVSLAPTITHTKRITAKIVGILEADDPLSEFWRYPGLFLDPGVILEMPEPGIDVRREPPVALFVEHGILVDVVGETYPGSLAVPFWFILAKTDHIKKWTIPEAQKRLEGFENEISKSMPGADFLTGGFSTIVKELNRKSFISRLPILVFLVIMIAALLSCVVMVASCLASRREGDLAMIRTRGGSTFQVLRLYGLEAFVLVVIAVVIAPFLAMGAVAMAGKLPQFTQATGGAMLQVKLTGTPFLAALGAGAFSLAILLIPSLLSGRSGLALQKLRSSRPPNKPFFHRYHLDWVLFVLGALILWEINVRGQLVSGGLFNEIGVNETLLLAPALFLVVAGLVFVRIFPLVVRFLSGESADLVHFLMLALMFVLLFTLGVPRLLEAGVWHSVMQVTPVLAFGTLYFAANRIEGFIPKVTLIMTQVGAVALLVYQGDAESDETVLISAIVLIGIVCAQLIFLCLNGLAKSSPVWLSLSLWKMTRNPLQYTWLMVLLLLATGLCVLSVTVGGTLDQGQRDKVQYDVAADLRVSGISANSRITPSSIEEALVENPGVFGSARAYRDSGHFGSVEFSLLGLEVDEFSQISWYRPDFSNMALGDAMKTLHSSNSVGPILIPASAGHIGLWARPEEKYSELFVWVVLGDSSGQLRVVSLGQINSLEWQKLEAEIPSELVHPRTLIAVQVFEPAGRLMSLGSFASQVKGTPGIVHFDDINSRGKSKNEEVVLEDFEGGMNWRTIVTGAVEPDHISVTGGAFHGQASARFSFSADRNRLVRGFHRSPVGDAIPAVVSTSFQHASGVSEGDRFVARVDNRYVPFVVVGFVEYFPTLSPERGGFVIVSLDALMYHVNLVSEQKQVTPNELFVKTLPGTEKITLEKARQIATGVGSVQGTHELIDSFQNDPLSGVGLRSLVFVALGIFVVSVSVGCLSFFISSKEQNINEAGILQTIGISRIQLFWLFAVENGFVLITGVALGTWAGLQISSLMVSALSGTVKGGALPPVIVATDWTLVCWALGVLAAAVFTSLLIVNRVVLLSHAKVLSRSTD